MKPGYNVQLSTEGQYVLNYTLHPNPTDTLTLPAHIQDFKDQLQILPQTLTTDGGYGSEQNYEYPEQQGIEAYVKYNYFDREQRGQANEFAGERLYYNAQQDYLVCPMGQHMKNMGTYKRVNRNGFEQTVAKYQASNCNGCPMRGVCHKSKHNRIVELNHNLIRLKKQAAEKLQSEEGIRKRKNDAQMWNQYLPTGSKIKGSDAPTCVVGQKYWSKSA